MSLRTFLTTLKNTGVFDYVTGTDVVGDKRALDVAVVAGGLTVSPETSGPDRAEIDFTSTPVLDSAFTLLITSTAVLKKLDITNNSGGAFSLRINGAEDAYIPPGYVGKIPVNMSIGETIEIQSLSGTVNSGRIFMNTERTV